jgi:hypothetical protein
MIRSRINKKTGLLSFYNGRKKATESESKSFIKLNYDAINPETLSSDNRRYLGSVKGGKNRANSTLVDKGGRFLPKNIQDKALKTLGINVEALRKAKNLKSLRDVFRNNKELSDSFDRLIEDTGVELFYNDSNNKVIDKVKSYNGDVVIFNGEQMTATDASLEVSKYIKKLRRKFDLYYPGVAICLLYRGINTLIINCEHSVIENGIDTVNVQLFHSNKGGKKSKKNGKKNS